MKKIALFLSLTATFAIILGNGYGKSNTPLTFYFIDVGPGVGNATLIVSPSGQSIMLDAGPPYAARRVLDVIRRARVKQIDYMVVTHFHSDHFGGVPYLSQNLRIVNFVDHGPSVEYGRSDAWWHPRRAPWFHPGMGKRHDNFYDNYLKIRATGHHIVVKPGDRIPIKGIDVTVLTAAGKGLTRPLPGAGQPNPACAGIKLRQEDDAEDGQSIGVLITYGKFRFTFLGDLTWDVSYRLFCPNNKVGTVDAYLITHHGMNLVPALGPYSLGTNCCNKAEVYGLHPRVAILSVGPRGWGKNGNGDALRRVRSSPGLEDLWQTNYLVGGGMNVYTSPNRFCANAGTTDGKAEFIRLSAEPGGSFSVSNSRNGFTKHYPAH